MKIRSGFVSNSSTTSFCIYGAAITTEQIDKIAKKLGITEEDDKEDGIASKVGLEFHYGECRGRYFGRSWADIGDDVTGKQFKDSIERIFTEELGIENPDCGTIEEAWRDG